jgi:hypothetical protein
LDVRRLFVFSVPVAAIAACTAFSSSPDGPAPGDDGGHDASDAAAPPADAPPDVPAGDAPAADAAAPGAVFDDDFEMTTNCNPWTGTSAILGVVDGGANGTAHACRVCLADPTGYAYRYVEVDAGSYVLDGYARAPDGGSWDTRVDIPTADGGVVYANNFGPFSPTFAPIQGAIVVPQATKLTVYILAGGLLANDCFDIDELTLH